MSPYINYLFVIVRNCEFLWRGEKNELECNKNAMIRAIVDNAIYSTAAHDGEISPESEK